MKVAVKQKLNLPVLIASVTPLIRPRLYASDNLMSISPLFIPVFSSRVVCFVFISAPIIARISPLRGLSRCNRCSVRRKNHARFRRGDVTGGGRTETSEKQTTEKSKTTETGGLFRTDVDVGTGRVGDEWELVTDRAPSGRHTKGRISSRPE